MITTDTDLKPGKYRYNYFTNLVSLSAAHL